MKVMLPPIGGVILNETRLAASERRDWSDVNGSVERVCSGRGCVFFASKTLRQCIGRDTPGIKVELACSERSLFRCTGRARLFPLRSVKTGVLLPRRITSPGKIAQASSPSSDLSMHASALLHTQ